MEFSWELVQLLLEGTRDTLIMVFATTALGYVIGLPLGVLLTVSDKNGIAPRPALYRVLDFLVNILRSIPFLILIILLIPATRALVGQSYGTRGIIPPLTIAAFPFIARLVESSLKEVDHGVIEAAQSMGAGHWHIITRVLLGEARTSLLVGVTIALGTIFGYTAMAGVVGGGGLGDIAIRYGYYRYEYPVMIVTVVIMVVLMQIFQAVGNVLSKKLDRRKS